MAERIQKATQTRNTNQDRKRLKAKDSPKSSRKKNIKIQQKKDRKTKLTISILTLALVLTLGYFTLNTRNQLLAKRAEYRKLASETISQELKRDRLEAKLENTVDINRIQRYALEELGMVYEKTGAERIDN
ncbi:MULTISPECIES: hypothetical protein [Anaerococcus]|uniref:Cell division protein FtsL n=2 Tax=Anaerococcus TaxID=165779 RepID=A0ABW9MVG5_9FIRM